MISARVMVTTIPNLLLQCFVYSNNHSQLFVYEGQHMLGAEPQPLKWMNDRV